MKYVWTYNLTKCRKRTRPRKVKRIDIFRLRLKGLSIEQIARILNVSPATVYRHLKVIAKRWNWKVKKGSKTYYPYGWSNLLKNKAGRKRKYEIRKDILIEVLKRSRTLKEAAKRLGINYSTLYYRLTNEFKDVYEAWLEHRLQDVKL